MLILTETGVEEGARPDREAADARPAPALRGRGQPDIVGDHLHRHRRRRRARTCAWSRSSATPTRRCTRPSRSAATRPTSSPSPTTTPACRGPRSRRPAEPRAVEIGQQARDAATVALDLRPRAAAPLPRPAVGADRLDRRRRSPASCSCPTPRSIDCGSPRSCTTSARSPCPRRSSRSRRPSTSAEWRTVVQHPRIGQVILEQAAALKDAVPIILHHHERYAGHGYPFGLRGNEIPLGARIVAIADAYDAMVHDRPYKRAMSHDQAIAELRRHAGTQFDPELVEPLLRPVRGPRPGAGPDGARDDPARGHAAHRRAGPARHGPSRRAHATHDATKDRVPDRDHVGRQLGRDGRRGLGARGAPTARSGRRPRGPRSPRPTARQRVAPADRWPATQGRDGRLTRAAVHRR